MKKMLRYLQKLEERRLVQEFLSSRSERAFLKLYRRFTATLYQLVLRTTGGRTQDAEEIIQDTWVRAIRKLSLFRWESSFRTWLISIAINCCREHFRKQQKHQQDIYTDDFEMGGRAIDMETQLDLEFAISKLSNGYRQVLVLHDIEGYTHEEIGKMLSISTGTSKSQLFHARKAIRKYL